MQNWLAIALLGDQTGFTGLARSSVYRLLERGRSSPPCGSSTRWWCGAASHKRVVHPELGVLDLHCQVLHTDSQDQILLVYTASPGTEGYEKPRLLSVLGSNTPTAS